MSRMWVAGVVAMAAVSAPVAAQVTAEDIIFSAGERLAITDTECESDGRAIVVCARVNKDDRYRLPFETVVAGDPDAEGFWGERERIQANPGTCQSWALFRSNCGAVGASVGIGGGTQGVQLGGIRRVGQ